MDEKKPNRATISLCFSRDTPLDTILHTFFELDQHYRFLTGEGIELTNIESLIARKEGYAGEMYSGTEFEERKVLEKEMFPKYIGREEVYSILKKRSSPKKATEIREKLDRSYPKETWGEEFPLDNILGILIKYHLSDMNYPVDYMKFLKTL